jgi:hypothetical protein
VPAHAVYLSDDANADMRRIHPFHLRRILSAIRANLEHAPLVETRIKKPLEIERFSAELIAAFRQTVGDTERTLEPWELSAGAWRVVYLAESHAVTVLRIFEKPGHLDFAAALLRWDRLR